MVYQFGTYEPSQSLRFYIMPEFKRPTYHYNVPQYRVPQLPFNIDNSSWHNFWNTSTYELVDSGPNIYWSNYSMPLLTSRSGNAILDYGMRNVGFLYSGRSFVNRYNFYNNNAQTGYETAQWNTPTSQDNNSISRNKAPGSNGAQGQEGEKGIDATSLSEVERADKYYKKIVKPAKELSRNEIKGIWTKSSFNKLMREEADDSAIDGRENRIINAVKTIRQIVKEEDDDVRLVIWNQVDKWKKDGKLDEDHMLAAINGLLEVESTKGKKKLAKLKNEMKVLGSSRKEVVQKLFKKMMKDIKAGTKVEPVDIAKIESKGFPKKEAEAIHLRAFHGKSDLEQAKLFAIGFPDVTMHKDEGSRRERKKARIERIKKLAVWYLQAVKGIEDNNEINKMLGIALNKNYKVKIIKSPKSAAKSLRKYIKKSLQKSNPGITITDSQVDAQVAQLTAMFESMRKNEKKFGYKKIKDGTKGKLVLVDTAGNPQLRRTRRLVWKVGRILNRIDNI